MTRIIRITVSFFLLLSGVQFTMAQSVVGDYQQRVTGLVVDGADGCPLPGATVYYRDNSNGKYLPKAVTDLDGRFELGFVPKDSLMVSYIGCKTQRFLPTGDSILVRMEAKDSIVFVCPLCVVYPVSGVVLDEKGKPIIGATVKIKGCNTVVATGINGEFRINTQKRDVLEISYLGFKTKTKKVSIKKPMKIKLKPSSNVISCQ